MLEIALASQSPRRRFLLNEHGFSFRAFPLKVSEIIDENLNPQEVARSLSEMKARTAVEEYKELKSKGFLVLGADTIVVLGQRILGKPENPDQAFEFLRALSGATHSVITGITLLETGSSKFWTGVDQTKVHFHPLSDTAIREYIATGEPNDKAGAYGMQGEGKKFVSSCEGSESNVIGLPMELLMKVLKENAWNVRKHPPANR